MNKEFKLAKQEEEEEKIDPVQKMLNRQQETVMLSSSSSSSSRRQNLPHHQNQDRSIKPIGCLSGILHLVSNYHHRRRKFLTFGKKQGKNCDVELPIKSSSLTEETDHNKVLSEGNQISSSSSTTTTKKKKEDGGGERRHCHVQRLSCQVPRSPTLPSEIRHWDSDVISPENFRGLTLRDGGSTTTTPSPPTLNRVDEQVVEKEICRSSAEEKRRKLLGALEKCDEDLKAIKNIIDALRTSATAAEHRRGVKSPTSEEKFEVSCTVEEINLKMKDKGCTEFKHSPISVLDNFISPPLNLDTTSCFSKRHITKAGQMVPQQKPQPRKNPREEDTITGTSFFHRVTTIGVSVPIKHEIAAWSSKAVGETVVEVCNDMDCGERREVTRIGLVLQDCIFRDLVDQVVKELVIVGRAATGNCLYSLLPLDACKKRLRF